MRLVAALCAALLGCSSDLTDSVGLVSEWTCGWDPIFSAPTAGDEHTCWAVPSDRPELRATEDWVRDPCDVEARALSLVRGNRRITIWWSVYADAAGAIDRRISLAEVVCPELDGRAAGE